MSGNDTFTGIVMYRKNYREADVLTKVLTREAGKRMFFLKNGKRPSYALASETLPYTYATYEGRLNPTGLSFLNTAKQATHFRLLNEDIEVNAYATYILSLIDAAFEDRVIITGWFDQILAAFAKLNDHFDPQVISQIIALKLLPDFGVPLQLQGCVMCGELTDEMDFSDKYHGLLCSKHFNTDRHRLNMTPKALYYLRLFSNIDITQVNSINVHQETKVELQRVIDLIYDNTVGIHVRARSFIEQMDTWQQALIASRKPKVGPNNEQQ
ncbi:DNA repair protein RecO [Periweissella fabalis]|uniref:DNA repair protein RecO n=1 Tax=Periweissella fabalis TaxID=1070421 RepID=A0A7X6N4A6_9LACO|nr:DNA repair protein RecO [Periweissella fabalis]MCM0599369.1 DNA repair protein RecO [Periweissella fabalis]NKZ23648.1 DNA repair protein RecO [Periweissella fabalis]